jgi:hypothetical protein
MVVADQSTQTGGAKVAVKAPGAIVIDKNKAPEQYIKEAESKYIVPQLVREKFPDLVKLIYETESMNEEEREYWLQIMPIMSEEQLVKFRNILVNEKEQLAKLDREYSQESGKFGGGPAPEIDEKKLKDKMEKIKAKEIVDEEKEKSDEESLLNQLKNF